MRSLGLCKHGGQSADQPPLDNGQLPHGGYKGSKRHPLSILSFNKGAEFKQNMGQELERMLLQEQTMPQGTSPSWAVLLHRAPSHTDESQLLTNNLLTVSKLGQTAETNIFNQNLPQSGQWSKSMRDIGRLYYRPNSTHQFLSTTDLKDCAEGQVNINYGRPTRTSLLRALQRRDSAGANSYHTRRDFLHRLHDLRNSSQANPFTEFFKHGKPSEGEAFHSFLTGARYNRYNPALGCCCTEIKADETPLLTTRIPKQPTTVATTYRFRPSTTPGQGTRHAESGDLSQAVSYVRTTPLKLKVIGNNPSVNKFNDAELKLPRLQASMSSPGKQHSRCPKKDSLGMYSSRSNSARADSDIQDISDSVKNAIIACNEETGPGCLQAAQEAESGVAVLDRVPADEKEDKTLENLPTGSSGSLSSVGLLVISLPADTPSSLQHAGDDQAEEKATYLTVHKRYFPENDHDNRQENGYKQSNSNDEKELETDLIDDKNDENELETDLIDDKNDENELETDLIDDKNDENELETDLIDDKNDENELETDLIADKNDENELETGFIDDKNDENELEIDLIDDKNDENELETDLIDDKNDENELETDFIHDKSDENELETDFIHDKNEEAVGSSFLNDVVGDRTGSNIVKSIGQNDNGILANSDRNVTSVNGVLDHENNDNLTDSKHFNPGVSEWPGDGAEVIKEDDDASSEADDHQVNIGATVWPEDETVRFFITEENVESVENVGASNLVS